MAKYPEWIDQFREKGTTVKKNGNNYYLFKTKSKRVPGKKYPQAYSTYIGKITPEGVIRSNAKRLCVENIEVFEYGYSKAIERLMPEEWVKTFETKDEAQTVLKQIIIRNSPQSYLKDEYILSKQISLGGLTIREKSLEEAIGIPLSKLEILKTIYLLKFENKNVISRISEEASTLLKNLGIDIWTEQT